MNPYSLGKKKNDKWTCLHDLKCFVKSTRHCQNMQIDEAASSKAYGQPGYEMKSNIKCCPWNAWSVIVPNEMLYLSLHFISFQCFWSFFHASFVYSFTFFPSFSTLVFLPLSLCVCNSLSIYSTLSFASIALLSIDNFFPFHCANKT